MQEYDDGDGDDDDGNGDDDKPFTSPLTLYGRSNLVQQFPVQGSMLLHFLFFKLAIRSLFFFIFVFSVQLTVNTYSKYVNLSVLYL